MLINRMLWLTHPILAAVALQNERYALLDPVNGKFSFKKTDRWNGCNLCNTEFSHLNAKHLGALRASTTPAAGASR